MTERLYYDDSYLREFDAVVTGSILNDDGSCTVYLDRSAFYPTSGGQPFDTGTINGIPVLDVSVDDNGDVPHRISGYIPVGTSIHCVIDWERRFDHMQQHAGEHTLAGTVYRELGGHTIGLHLGKDVSTIDVDLPDGRTHLTDAEKRLLEDEVNLRIQRDVPIKCWFPDSEELKSLPLRKPPTVAEHIRIVQIGDDEFCACGGTHPSTAGQIGLFKLLDARPARGKLRLTFVCGKRAFEYLRNCYDALTEVNLITSSTYETAAENVRLLTEKLKQAEYDLRQQAAAFASREIEGIVSAAGIINGVKVVRHIFEGLDADSMVKTVTPVISGEKTVCLLASRNTDQSLLLLYARSQDVALNMGAVMKACGAKGGGKSDFARGSAQDEAVLEKAYAMCAEELNESV